MLPLPPFLLGNRDLIHPASCLPFLVSAEEEPAEPKLLMPGLGLCAGAAAGSVVELDRRDAHPLPCHTAPVPKRAVTRI